MSQKSSFIVFLQLFVIMHHRIKRYQLNQSATLNLESFFINEINRLGFRGKNIDSIKQYFRSGKGELTFHFSPTEEQMKEVVSMAYELICHSIGPVATDDIFGEAIQRVEKTAAGIAYSPRNFF